MESWNCQVAATLYAPLQGTLPLRILTLLPGRRGDPIRCRLNPTTVEEADQQYEATSYTWGSPENPVTIECDSLPLKIQQNAFHMLSDLRLPDKARSLWIDAICINQGDLSERAQQVSFMHTIYSSAQSVAIWLGQPDEHSEVAMKFAATLDLSKYKSVGKRWWERKPETRQIWLDKMYVLRPDGDSQQVISESAAISLVIDITVSKARLEMRIIARVVFEVSLRRPRVHDLVKHQEAKADVAVHELLGSALETAEILRHGR